MNHFRSVCRPWWLFIFSLEFTWDKNVNVMIIARTLFVCFVTLFFFYISSYIVISTHFLVSHWKFEFWSSVHKIYHLFCYLMAAHRLKNVNFRTFVSLLFFLNRLPDIWFTRRQINFSVCIWDIVGLKVIFIIYFFSASSITWEKSLFAPSDWLKSWLKK